MDGDPQPEPMERLGVGGQPRCARLCHARAAGRPIPTTTRCSPPRAAGRKSCSGCRPPLQRPCRRHGHLGRPPPRANREGRVDLRRGQRLCRRPPGLRRLHGRSRATEFPPLGPAIAGDHPGRYAQGLPGLRGLPGGRARRAAAYRRARGPVPRARWRRSNSASSWTATGGRRSVAYRSGRPPGGRSTAPSSQQALGSSTVEIAKGSRTLQLRFD